MMFTTDLALRTDPAYTKISKHFYENPQAFADAFSRALRLSLRTATWGLLPDTSALWFLRNSELWQDPLPTVDHELIGESEIADLKAKILVRPTFPSPNWSRPRGHRLQHSAAVTSAAGQTGRVFASSRKRIGKSTSRQSSRRFLRNWRSSSPVSTPAARRFRLLT